MIIHAMHMPQAFAVTLPYIFLKNRFVKVYALVCRNFIRKQE